MSVLSEFKPPKPNRAFILLCELLLPLYARLVEDLSIEFQETPDQWLEFLKDKQAVIIMNHADRQDPLVLVALTRYMREFVYCVVAREVFDWNHGINGWLFQKLGCYSVNRGMADFRSIHTTRKLLTHSHRKLIV
ncbi:MAG: 1-acyl-sn-glycerol-3-phosphate acyltransferase, partial [Cyanobacteria bacterium]|nr:1-acyl-sn-glycerol-3-phosphate acyltransferase [Cyanobacteriota bacterium]